MRVVLVERVSVTGGKCSIRSIARSSRMFTMVFSTNGSSLVVGVVVVVVVVVVDKADANANMVGCWPFARVQSVSWHCTI